MSCSYKRVQKFALDLLWC